MKLVITALALIAASGCTTYVSRDGSYSPDNEIVARDCRHEAQNDPRAPTIADMNQYDGMGAFNRAAGERLENLINECMMKRGYLAKS